MTPNTRHYKRAIRTRRAKARPLQKPIHAYRSPRSFMPAFFVMVAGMHGVAFGGARFVNDALEQAPDGGVGQRSGIVVLGVFEHFVFALRLVERNVLRLLELADFQGTTRALVEQLDQFLVDFIDAATPVGKVHGATSRRERPWRAASLCLQGRGCE